MITWAKNFGLVIFTWGEMNNNKETIDELKRLGVDAVIFDRCRPLTLSQEHTDTAFPEIINTYLSYFYLIYLLNCFFNLA